MCIRDSSLSFLGNLLALAGPRLSGAAINLIAEGMDGSMDLPGVYKYAAFMLLFYVSSSLMSYAVNVSMITLSRRITYTLRKDTFNHLVTLPVSFFDGTNISKGQKQLLTIARALLMRTPMLILDEATSNVDTRTEHQIQAAMRALMTDKTCFVVAHRLSTIQNADCILVVRDGNVVERGTHEELMRQKGFYYEMHQAQYR